MNKKQYILSLFAILFITMIIVSGSTFAYMQWRSSVTQETALNIKVTEKINMRIDNPSDTEIGMYPTISCGGEAGMSFVSTVTIENQTGVLAAPNFKLKVKITDVSDNVITNDISEMDLNDGDEDTNNPYRYYINYAVTEEKGVCTEPLYTGRFDVDQATIGGNTDWYDSESITLEDDSEFPLLSSGANSGVSFNAEAYNITTHNYKVWVWVDSSYTTIVSGDNSVTDKLQDAKITVSFSENSEVKQKGNNEFIAYAVYSAQDTSLRFYDATDLIEEGATYNNLPATKVYKIYSNDNYSYDSETEHTTSPWDGIRDSVTQVMVEDYISPTSTANWFNRFIKTSTIDVSKLNVSNVINMERMFERAGNDETVTTFTITGLNGWNTSNVTSMRAMFNYAGSYATTWSVGDLSGWNTFKVTNMEGMFNQAGQSTATFNIGNLSNWNVSNVTSMRIMFQRTGHNSKIFNIGDLDNWDVSNVTDMSLMFNRTAGDSTTFNIGDLSNWDVSKVTDMKAMFQYTAYSTKNFNIGNLDNWDVSNVTDMSWMFNQVGYKAITFNIGNLNNWDTSNVTDMNHMFQNTCYNLKTCHVGDLSGWDTSKVTDMKAMFHATGYNATTFNIGNIGNWNVSNVTDMSFMFDDIGYKATTFYIGDLSNWNVSKVTNMAYMINSTGYSVETFYIGDLSNWDVSKVTDMDSMFDDAGYNATTFSLGNLAKWNVSKVTNMTDMFNDAGKNADWSLDLSSWNVCKVTAYDGFNYSVTDKIILPNFGMICPN